MTGASFLLLALTLVVAAGDWHAVFHRLTALEYVCKPLTMVVLIATAVALDVDQPAVRVWFVVALVFCLLGDVFLMLPSDKFVFGLASFLIGHLAYIVGMQVDGVVATRLAVGAVLVLVVVVVVGTQIVGGVRRGSEPELTGPVLAYMTVISVMVMSAIGTGHPAAILGAGSFFASDALIAWNRFLRETRHARLAIMVTYHLAQIGLVLSLV
ncbi:MAG: lysoplasmalogenase [Microthrixaceae bacterium]